MKNCYFFLLVFVISLGQRNSLYLFENYTCTNNSDLFLISAISVDPMHSCLQCLYAWHLLLAYGNLLYLFSLNGLTTVVYQYQIFITFAIIFFLPIPLKKKCWLFFVSILFCFCKFTTQWHSNIQTDENIWICKINWIISFERIPRLSFVVSWLIHPNQLYLCSTLQQTTHFCGKMNYVQWTQNSMRKSFKNQWMTLLLTETQKHIVNSNQLIFQEILLKQKMYFHLLNVTN